MLKISFFTQKKDKKFNYYSHYTFSKYTNIKNNYFLNTKLILQGSFFLVNINQAKTIKHYVLFVNLYSFIFLVFLTTTFPLHL